MKKALGTYSTYAVAIHLATMCMYSPLAAQSSAQSSADRPWFERSIVGMEVGPSGAQYGYSDANDKRYCALWNGGEIVRACAAANSEYLVLWVRDGDYAYYSSKLLPKAPGLGDRDPLRDAVSEAKRLKLPLIAYCVVQQGGHFLKAHPEWEMRGADGQPIGRFCFNSGYLEAMKQIVAEQLAYGIDGFHIDMLDQGFGPPYGCWCPTCQDLFKAKYGHKMPGGPTWNDAWNDMLEFRYDTSETFERQLTAYIKSINPNVSVDYNYHGNPPFSFEVGHRPVQHAGNADFVTGETGLWAFSALGVGLNAEFYRTSTPHREFQVAIQRGVRMYHDQTTRPVNDMRWELFTLLAHGAFVTMIDKTGFDGALDPVAYDRMGQVLGEARTKRDHFGQPPVYDIGIYFSSRTRDWMGRDEPAKYFQSFQGAHQACAMEHLQFGVVLDESVSLKELKQFPVVCLPNVAILSEREVGLLRDYVKEGGKLLITGQSGQFGQHGEPLNDSLLAELIGARVVSRLNSQDNWVRLDDPSEGATNEATELSRGFRTNWPFLVVGPATVYQTTTAQEYGQLLRPYRTTQQMQGKMGTELPSSADAAVGPAVLVNRIQKGTVITFAASPDFATASEHSIVEARKLFHNAFRALQPHSRVKITAPANVEAVVTDESASRELRVHLIASNPTPRSTPRKNRPFVLPGLTEDIPIFRVTLSVAELPRSVVSVNPATQILLDGHRIEATIEDIHDVVIIHY